MAHFAKLNSENEVLSVVVVDNYNLVDGTGTEKEEIGVAYLQSVFGVEESITWKQTSYNGNIRKNYAGIGYTYDIGRDAFVPPKPFTSWVLNEETCRWESPIPTPKEEGKFYNWNESTTSWDEIEITKPV
jgi:hypothetical protein